MQKDAWRSFWSSEGRAFFNVMEVSTQVFAKRLIKHFNSYTEPRVLDYGCGPGFLIDYLTKHNFYCAGVDINPFFIKEAQSKHPNSKFILIDGTPEGATVLERELSGEAFDLIILLSVCQYLPSTESVADLIGELKNFLTPKGRIVIADVVTAHTSSLRDAMSAGFHCIIRGRIVSFIKFIFYLLSARYRSLATQQKLLHLSEDIISQIASQYGMSYQRVDGLTAHPTRNSYILALS